MAEVYGHAFMWNLYRWENPTLFRGQARHIDLPPGRPSFIASVLGVDSHRFRVGQARRTLRTQIAQAPGALLLAT